MGERIRKAGMNDLELLMRFLERSYGHRRNYFLDNYGYLLRDAAGAGEKEPAGSYIVEKDGRILSHVGLYPLYLSCKGVKLNAAGIGNVATAPEARGRGYMGKLLLCATADMEAGGVPLCVLWGDRHRYGHFGWETAGEKLNIVFSGRSFEKAGIRGIRELEEAGPDEAAGKAGEFHGKIDFRAERGGNLEEILGRKDNRVWLAGDGYICGKDGGGRLYVNEVYSSSGNEAGMVLSAMSWCGLDRAEISVSPQDGAAVEKLLPAAASWNISPEGMFRINDWEGFLKPFLPVMEKRARQRGVKDFGIRLGIGTAESREYAGFEIRGGSARLTEAGAANTEEISGKEAVRLFLGGPFCSRGETDPLGVLLPLPVHVPALDHV